MLQYLEVPGIPCANCEVYGLCKAAIHLNTGRKDLKLCTNGLEMGQIARKLVRTSANKHTFLQSVTGNKNLVRLNNETIGETIMSHELDMYVENTSQYALKSFSVTHTWDDIGNTLSGENLKKGATSASQVIKSGYTQYDWYTVQVTFADPNESTKTMDFYCNSSYSQNKVKLQIYTSHLNCRYYNKDTGKYETGCLDKGWT